MKKIINQIEATFSEQDGMRNFVEGLFKVKKKLKMHLLFSRDKHVPDSEEVAEQNFTRLKTILL